MGGKGSGYRLPLQLSREMKMALDRLKVQEETADDFPVALRVLRVGFILHGVLDDDALQAMYQRGLITDDEVQFLMNHGLTSDFRPAPVRPLHEAEELMRLNHHFGQVVEQWRDLKESSKLGHVAKAKQYPTLPNAVALLRMVKAEARTMEVAQ